MPENMFGAMSKLEKQTLFAPKLHKAEHEASKDDSDGVQWDIDLDVAKEKAKAFDILAQFVPQAEIYLSAKPQQRNAT